MVTYVRSFSNCVLSCACCILDCVLSCSSCILSFSSCILSFSSSILSSSYYGLVLIFVWRRRFATILSLALVLSRTRLGIALRLVVTTSGDFFGRTFGFFFLVILLIRGAAVTVFLCLRTWRIFWSIRRIFALRLRSRITGGSCGSGGTSAFGSSGAFGVLRASLRRVLLRFFCFPCRNYKT